MVIRSKGPLMVAAVLVCVTFALQCTLLNPLDGLESDGDPDAAATDASGADPDASDSSDVKVPSCIPRDVAADADAPDASCNVDVATSPNHCGTCGHSCLGDGCQGGMCSANIIVPLTAGSPPTIGSVVDGTLYFSSYDKAYRASQDGGTPSEVLPGNSIGAAGIGTPLIAGGRLWARADGRRLVSTPLDATTPARVDVGDDVGLTATDGTNVFWTRTSTRSVQVVGGGAPIIDDPLFKTTYAMVADKDGVFLLVGMLSSPDMHARLLVRRPNGDVQELQSDVLGSYLMALDTAYVYWADFDGNVWRSGKTSKVKEAVMRVPGPYRAARGLVVDESSVYVAATQALDVSSTVGLFYVAQKCGGPARYIRQDPFVRGSVVGADRYLYWTHPDGVVRMAK